VRLPNVNLLLAEDVADGPADHEVELELDVVVALDRGRVAGRLHEVDEAVELPRRA
jgi:hypothetical protein